MIWREAIFSRLPRSQRRPARTLPRALLRAFDVFGE